VYRTMWYTEIAMRARWFVNYS